jgi:hypothetical protein
MEIGFKEKNIIKKGSWKVEGIHNVFASTSIKVVQHKHGLGRIPLSGMRVGILLHEMKEDYKSR